MESRERDNVWYPCDVVIYTIKCISTNCHAFDKREGFRNMFNIYIYEYEWEDYCRTLVWIDAKLQSRNLFTNRYMLLYLTWTGFFLDKGKRVSSMPFSLVSILLHANSTWFDVKFKSSDLKTKNIHISHYQQKLKF